MEGHKVLSVALVCFLVLLEEVKDSTTSTVITIGIFVVFILLLFVPSVRHAEEG